jgi:uncharacterized YigZ family protein
MNENLYIPEENSKAELIVKKSRFISQCFFIESDKEAKAIIKNLWSEHKYARHIVYGFIYGAKNSQTMGMTDDGEPKGTAGRPVLQVLKGSSITNILCTVVRYFGGIKLGTGGLVKAYTEAAQQAVKELKIKELIPEVSFSVTIGYELYDKIKKAAENYSAVVITESFTDHIYIELSVPEKYFKDMKLAVSDISNGKIMFTPIS